jgi:myb proto-oncogene protein
MPLVSDPFALPPRAPSSTSASATHSSPLINQNYPLLNQMQGMQQVRHHHTNHHPQPVFHPHHGGFRSAGLPPLPTRAREPPSNQIDTASYSDGLLEAMLLGDDDHHLLPRPNQAMCRAGSMPELMYGTGGASASDSDVTSQFPPPDDIQHPHHDGKWDFLFGQSVRSSL